MEFHDHGETDEGALVDFVAIELTVSLPEEDFTIFRRVFDVVEAAVLFEHEARQRGNQIVFGYAEARVEHGGCECPRSLCIEPLIPFIQIAQCASRPTKSSNDVEFLGMKVSFHGNRDQFRASDVGKLSRTVDAFFGQFFGRPVTIDPFHARGRSGSIARDVLRAFGKTLARGPADELDRRCKTGH